MVPPGSVVSRPATDPVSRLASGMALDTHTSVLHIGL